MQMAQRHSFLQGEVVFNSLTHCMYCFQFQPWKQNTWAMTALGWVQPIQPQESEIIRVTANNETQQMCRVPCFVTAPKVPNCPMWLS